MPELSWRTAIIALLIATLAVPLIAGYAYHKGAYKGRKFRRWAKVLEQQNVAV